MSSELDKHMQGMAAPMNSSGSLRQQQYASNNTLAAGNVQIVEKGVPERAHRTPGISEEKERHLSGHGFCGMSLVLRLVLTAACGSFLFGFNISLLNTSINVISSDFQWCDHPAETDCKEAILKRAFITTAVFIGAAIGALSGGRFLSAGRRLVLLVTLAVFALGIVTSCTATAFANLLWARLIVGYGVGVVSVVCPVYMSEMTPASLRGHYGVFHQLFVTIGLFVGVLLGIPLKHFPGKDDDDYNRFELRQFDQVWWRVMLGLGIIPVLLACYLLWRPYDFETPHYYVEADRPQDARRLLSALRANSDVETDFTEIQRARNDAVRAKQEGLSFTKAMSFPVYRNKLFEDAGLDTKLVTWLTVVLMLVNVLMTFPTIWLIERLGRRTLLLLGTIGLTLSVLPGAICLMIAKDKKWASWVAVGGAIAFIIFFASTYGPVLWVYLFEIYPIEIKGTASGLATAVNWVAGIVMVFITQFIPVRINYIIFCGMSLISVFIVYFLIRETQGRSLEDSPYMVDSAGRPISVTAVQAVGQGPAAELTAEAVEGKVLPYTEYPQVAGVSPDEGSIPAATQHSMGATVPVAGSTEGVAEV